MNSSLLELQEEMMLLNSREKLEYILELGKELEPLSLNEQTEENKIKGCTSKAYIKLNLQNEKIILEGTADSLIVRGYIQIMKKAVNEQTKEYVQNEFYKDINKFIDKTKLDLNMLPSRVNAFGSMVQHILKKSNEL